MKKLTAAEKKFALRMCKRAATLAQRSGDVFRNEQILWKLMTEATHKTPKLALVR